MKIGVTGAPGSGKTELAKMIAEKFGLPFITVDIDMIAEKRRIDVLRASAERTLARELQYAIFLAQADEEDRHESFVADKTAIDCLAYFVLYDLNGETGRIYKEKCLSRPYDLLVYVPCCREEFRELDGIIAGILRSVPAPVVEVSGPPEGALKTIERELKKRWT